MTKLATKYFLKIADILRCILGSADCETVNQLFFMVGLIGGFL